MLWSCSRSPARPQAQNCPWVKFGASGEYMVPRRKHKARSGPDHGTVPDATVPVLVHKDIGGVKYIGGVGQDQWRNFRLAYVILGERSVLRAILFGNRRDDKIGCVFTRGHIVNIVAAVLTYVTAIDTAMTTAQLLDASAPKTKITALIDITPL